MSSSTSLRIASTRGRQNKQVGVELDDEVSNSMCVAQHIVLSTMMNE